MQNETKDYKQKYLKYKTKYINIKNNIKGSGTGESNEEQNFREFIDWLNNPKPTFKYDNKIFSFISQTSARWYHFENQEGTKITFEVDNNKQEIHYKDDTGMTEKKYIIVKDNCFDKKFTNFIYEKKIIFKCS